MCITINRMSRKQALTITCGTILCRTMNHRHVSFHKQTIKYGIFQQQTNRIAIQILYYQFILITNHYHLYKIIYSRTKLITKTNEN